MTRLWRISNHCTLEGLGGEITEGRWHTPGRGKRIVYLSEHPALALVEILANLKGNPALFPDSYQLMAVDVEDTVWAARKIAKDAAEGTPSRTVPLARTQREGDRWLAGVESALMVVPSVPSPGLNVLFNPLHPDAGGVRIASCKWIAYDKRLFHIHEKK